LVRHIQINVDIDGVDAFLRFAVLRITIPSAAPHLGLANIGQTEAPPFGFGRQAVRTFTAELKAKRAFEPILVTENVGTNFPV
jgi:hypothetical protein